MSEDNGNGSLDPPTKRKTPKIPFHFVVNGYRRVIHARNQKDASSKAEKLWGREAIPIFGKRF